MLNPTKLFDSILIRINKKNKYLQLSPNVSYLLIWKLMQLMDSNKGIAMPLFGLKSNLD